MPLIKLAAAARKARMGSVTAMRRALVAAGVPVVSPSPGEWAVEQADLERYLAEPRTPQPKSPKSITSGDGLTGSVSKVRKRRS